MNKKLLIFLVLLSPIFLIAQSNFIRGNVVINNGDTLRGFINYIEWHKNPDNIQFKYRKEDNKPQSFNVEDVAWFNVSGYEAYAKFQVSVSTNQIDLVGLTEEIDTSSITKTVFLKEELTGDKINLYSYSDQIKQRFYVLDKKQATPRELLYRKTIKDMSEVSHEIFKQQLLAIAVQYGAFTSNLDHSIQNARYSKGDLREVVRKINSVNQTESTAENERKRRIAFFAGLGINRDRIDYKGQNLVTVDRLNSGGYDKYKEMVTTQNYLPRLSTGVDFFVNPAIGRLIIRTELSAKEMKSTTVSYYQFNEYSKPVENTYKLSSWNISFIPQLVYNYYNGTNYKCYVGIGPSLNYFLTSDNSVTKREINQTGSEANVIKNYFPFNKFSLSAIVRSGIQIKKRVDLSVLWGNPIEHTWSGSAGSVKAGLLAVSAGYYFGK